MDGSWSTPKGQNQATAYNAKTRLPNPQQNLTQKIPQGKKNIAPPPNPKVSWQTPPH